MVLEDHGFNHGFYPVFLRFPYGFSWGSLQGDPVWLLGSSRSSPSGSKLAWDQSWGSQRPKFAWWKKIGVVVVILGPNKWHTATWQYVVCLGPKYSRQSLIFSPRQTLSLGSLNFGPRRDWNPMGSYWRLLGAIGSLAEALHMKSHRETLGKPERKTIGEPFKK